ncbi:amidohydrolase [Jatrophihabitans cynanchi]|uniref:amidohydrolase n=1 Tax=Jatrophihabitans cynanchi TaxID=2944128 RepID=UPI0022B23CBC|nr:amidohydrolase family protein [Jatrophihabitans sp. SB3-54]
MQADVVLTGGRVLTMDPAAPTATAVAVRGERIAAVGSDEEILSAAGDGTRCIDLAGRTVVPGLIDSHTHVELTAYSRHHWTDVRGLTVRQVLDVVRAEAATSPTGSWIVLQGTFGQELPDRAALDDAAPEHPTAVRWSMHKFQLNGAGLDAAGITHRTVAPPGARIHFESSGRPTGLVEEGWDLLGWEPPAVDALRESIAETARTLFMTKGVTTIHEIAASRTGIAAYRQLAAGDGPMPRMGLALTAAPGHQPLITVDSFAGIGLPVGFGGAKLRLSAVKIFVDGGRDGALRSTLMGDPAHRWGLLSRAPQRLAEEVTAILGAGTQAWIHAIGDLAQEVTVSAIEQAVRAHPGLDHRTRIEHFGNEIYSDARMHRLIAAGGIPAPNPSFVFAEPDDPARRLPAGAVKYGLRTLLSAGAQPPGNSDTAGAQPFACNPWFTMQCMLVRANRNGVIVDGDEAISLDEALRMFTVDAARATFQEHELGSITVGKYADLAVLNKDPHAVPAEQLSTVDAEIVMVGGVVTTREQLAALARQD